MSFRLKIFEFEWPIQNFNLDLRRRRDDLKVATALEPIDNNLDGHRGADNKKFDPRVLQSSSQLECENTPVFQGAKQMQVNTESIDLFQKSGLSKFAAATVRLAEQQKVDTLHLSGSSNPKNDGSFINMVHAPRGFMEHEDQSIEFAD